MHGCAARGCVCCFTFHPLSHTLLVIYLSMVASLTESAPALLLDHSGADNSILEVIVHPVVLLQVLDHHTRRQDDNGRVIGTLLGKVHGSTVEVTNCFAVPHAERGEEVAIGKDFNKTMLDLHLRCNRKEVVVGWYASAASGGETTPELVTDTSSLIHEFYAGEAEGDPVHLVVDTKLEKDALPIRAFKSEPVIVQGEPVGNLFHELSLSLKSSEPESICVKEMMDVKEDSALVETNSSEGLKTSMRRLHDLLGQAQTYVDQVVDGKTPPDTDTGRKIADALATISRISPSTMDAIFHDSLQDMLMVSYLSKLTRTQMEIAEKLNASLGV